MLCKCYETCLTKKQGFTERDLFFWVEQVYYTVLYLDFMPGFTSTTLSET